MANFSLGRLLGKGRAYRSGANAGRLKVTALEVESMLAELDRSQAIIQFEPDGTIIAANRNFLAAMGYDLAEIQGRHHSIFVDPEFARSDAYRQFWADLRRGELPSGVFKRLTKSGRPIWIQATYSPVVDARGRVVKVIKHASDVTAQTLQNADYRGQIEAINLSQAVASFQLDGTILDANENFLNAFGYSLEEIAGRNHSLLVEPATAESQDYRELWESLGRGEHWASEAKRIGKDGRELWLQASYNAIRDPDGRPFKVVIYAADITERVLARQEAERVGQLVDGNLDKILEAVATANKQTTSAAAASNETAKVVQSVAAAAGQFQTSATEISRSMTLSTTQVGTAMEETGKADTATQQLVGAADAMNSIVSVIQEIAGQINMLALNATIESARAGEAGKGFAVVASEVKVLATQVAKATEQVSSEISGMQGIADDVVKRLGGIKDAVVSVEKSVTGVASAVEEQTETTREIAENMQSAAGAVQETSASLDSIAEAVQTANTLAEEGTQLYRSLRSSAA
ncbi:methyl-accepting chemotaxis protein [Algihabitans sp.]|uniref:methyl-accepting chemotaxis protein n=1 Tax=Algihabitans sp. TaxID=2821514 RepID=UPI003BAA9AD4